MLDKRTKIVCTIGPASNSLSTLQAMMRAGMNVARLNFSHGTHDEHKVLMRTIRQAAKKVGVRVALLQDLQGPKIRLGNLPKEGVQLHRGEEISFSTAIEEYKVGGPLPVTYKQLHKDVKPGHRLLMDDGLLDAEVLSVRGRVIKAKVTTGGLLKPHKGLNLPDSHVSVSPVTEKDWEDLEFGLEQEVDWVALSFVTDPKIVEKVRHAIALKCRSLGTVPPKIIAKIERRAAVERFPELLTVVDAIMVARGDLGIEIPPEEVPIHQKEFIELCRQAGKPVVVATQMMDSMQEHPRATRAETSDVANAVIDHTDAVMLSGESASGKYPVDTVKAMAAIIHEAEASRYDDISFFQVRAMPDLATGIAHAIHVMAVNGQIDALVSSCDFGELASKLGMFRPEIPIFLACPNESRARQELLHAGVHPFVMESQTGSFVHRAEIKLRKERAIKTGERVAYVLAGSKELQLVIRQT